ncbi:MAG: hypothetical protein IJX99_03585 [Clostridia bacterium]|nr:hypothetical protein [Clostridia bacterium]
MILRFFFVALIDGARYYVTISTIATLAIRMARNGVIVSRFGSGFAFNGGRQFVEVGVALINIAVVNLTGVAMRGTTITVHRNVASGRLVEKVDFKINIFVGGDGKRNFDGLLAQVFRDSNVYGLFNTYMIRHCITSFLVVENEKSSFLVSRERFICSRE